MGLGGEGVGIVKFTWPIHGTYLRTRVSAELDRWNTFLMQDARVRSIPITNHVSSILTWLRDFQDKNCKFKNFLLPHNSQKKLWHKENTTEYRSFSEPCCILICRDLVINFHVLDCNSIISWVVGFRSSEHVSRVWSFTLELDQHEKFCGRLAREHFLNCEWTMKSFRGGAQNFFKECFFFSRWSRAIFIEYVKFMSVSFACFSLHGSSCEGFFWQLFKSAELGFHCSLEASRSTFLLHQKYNDPSSWDSSKEKYNYVFIICKTVKTRFDVTDLRQY